MVSAAPGPPTIHKATLGSLGRVIWGDEITEAEAVAERLAGRDVVVRGPDLKANSDLAKRIESQAGPWQRGAPHTRLGPYVLPHYQPLNRPPEGHTFYESEHRKAAKNP